MAGATPKSNKVCSATDEGVVATLMQAVAARLRLRGVESRSLETQGG